MAGKTIPAMFKNQRAGLALAGMGLGLAYLVLSPLYFAIALAALVLLLVGVARYRYLVYLAVALLPLEKIHLVVSLEPKLDQFYMAKFYPYQVPLFFAALGFFLKKTVDRTPLVFTPLDPWLWIISAYLCLSVLWSPDQTLALIVAINVIVHLTLYHLVVNAVSREEHARQYLVMMMIAGILAAVGIFISKDMDETVHFNLNHYIQLTVAFGKQASRAAGIGGADHVGGFVATAIFAYLGYIMLLKGWRLRTLLTALMITCLGAVLYTVSRGGFLAITAAFLAGWYLHDRLRPHIMKLAAAYALVSLLLVVLVAPGIIDRMLIGFGYTGQLLVSSKQFTAGQAGTKAGGNLTGMGARLNWWKTTLKEMNSKPWQYLTGVGLAGFSFYSVFQGEVSPETNSIYFSFFFEGGLLGVMILFPVLYLILTSLYNAYQGSQGDPRTLVVAALTMAVSDMMVRGLIDYDLFSYGAKFCFNQMAFLMATVTMINRGEPLAVARPWRLPRLAWAAPLGGGAEWGRRR